LAKWFQRRRLKCEKLTEDRCQVMAKAHIAFDKVSRLPQGILVSDWPIFKNLLL
jgi:hypothetical protein